MEDSSISSSLRPDRVWSKLRKIPKDDEAMFRLATICKMSLIPLITCLILGGFLATILAMDLYFFEANGVSQVNYFAETYYDFLFNRLESLIPWLALFIIFTAFISVYISERILRPFRIISDYCEMRVEGKPATYDPEFFSDLKLLTGFSEYFFNIMENAQKRGRLEAFDVPLKYTRIHKPVFEMAFFLQYSLFILITSIAAAANLYMLTVDLHDGVIQLAHETLRQSSVTTHFLNEQVILLDNILAWVIALHILLYFLLAIHLYTKVSAPAFGIFATMRAFSKGNHASRVHLIGHYYLRPYCRKINRYLDHLQKNLAGKSD